MSLVMAMDERVMKEQVEKARKRIALGLVASHTAPAEFRDVRQEPLHFARQIGNVCRRSRDLLNECMTFLDDQLSVLTGPYEQLLSLDDVIDQELILVVSLNINKNPEPMRVTGKDASAKSAAGHRQEVRKRRA